MGLTVKDLVDKFLELEEQGMGHYKVIVDDECGVTSLKKDDGDEIVSLNL